MELKQLEFFITCVECGSFGKAALKLYTSQPNVSKTIRSLEDELGKPVFERASRGLKLTPYGKSIYDYALNTVKNANLILETSYTKKENTLYLSTYQSNSISKLLIKLYKNNKDLSIEHRQGTAEEIIRHVEHGISEIGILYISQKKINAFLNIISRKKLDFIILGKLKACLYAGKNSSVYNEKSIPFDKLSELKYVTSLNDFFSIEDGLEHVSLGLIKTDVLKTTVRTNSDHMATNFLLQTDLVDIGINFDYPKRRQYDIKNISIEGEDSYLAFGYVIEQGHAISKYAEELIDYIKKALKP